MYIILIFNENNKNILNIMLTLGKYATINTYQTIQNHYAMRQTVQEERQVSIINLPKDVIEHFITPLLSLRDLSRLARTCHGANKLFKQHLTEIGVARLLQHVAFGEQEQAEKMLQSTPGLLLHKGNVTDYSRRTFHSITAFQYALWALDRHMWTMILKYLPREEATKQLHDHVYNQKDSYYDFAPLINALQTYVDNCDDWTDDEHSQHWIKVVGGAQRLVPVHVVNEYCREDRSFGLLPQFNEGHLPRGVTFYNHLTGSGPTWFPLTSKGLGVDCAVLRGTRDVRVGLASTGAMAFPLGVT